MMSLSVGYQILASGYLDSKFTIRLSPNCMDLRTYPQGYAVV